MAFNWPFQALSAENMIRSHFCRVEEYQYSNYTSSSLKTSLKTYMALITFGIANNN